MEQKQPRPTRDPRLTPVRDGSLTTLAHYGRMAGLAGLVLLVAYLLWAGTIRSMTRTPVLVVGILSLLCIAFWIYSNIRQLMVGIRTRGFQSALNSTIFTVLVLGVLVALNYIGGRHDYIRHDFTKNKQFSLSEATVNVITKLDKPVKITAFVSDEAPGGDDLRRLLREYKLKSSKITLDMYDFKMATDKVQEYDVRFDPTTYIECGQGAEKKKEEVQSGSEEQITSAILAATTGQKIKACFLTGHGEASLDAGGAADKPSLAEIKGQLEKQQYLCEPLSLMTMAKPEVPSDCKLLVIAGAKYAPTAAEMDAIKRYLDQAGNLFLMLEPAPAPDFADLLKAHGVTPVAGKVSDPGRMIGRPQILAALPQEHDVVGRLQVVVMPTSVALDVQEATPPPAMPGAPPPPSDQKAVPILTTTDRATLAGGVTGRRGPFKVAVAIDESPKPPQQMPGMEQAPPPEDNTRKARIVVVGDSDFATDAVLHGLGAGLGDQNFTFAIRAVNWLVKNDKLVAVPPKEPADKPFTVNDAQKRFTWVITVAIVPLLIIVSGSLMWWLRRRV